MMESFEKEIQEHLDKGHYCVLLTETWLYCETTYAKLLLRAYLGIDGNSYYVYTREEFGILKSFLDSGELDESAAAELESALADSQQQAITEFENHRKRSFYPGIVPITTWEQTILMERCGIAIPCWGESRFEAMLEALLPFANLEGAIPYVCLNPGADPRFDILLDVLEELSVTMVDMHDTGPMIDGFHSDVLHGNEGLRLFCEVAGVLLLSHLEDLGEERIMEILECGVSTIWADLEPFQEQDPAAVATPFLMVGLA